MAKDKTVDIAVGEQYSLLRPEWKQRPGGGTKVQAALDLSLGH